MAELSVLIPARSERWLSRTVEDVVAHAKGDTEIIIALDGEWPERGYELKQHENVHVMYLPEAIGQRAAVNLAAMVSTARYVMKLDAHCAVADGFDVELIRAAKDLGHDVTQIPAQHNLHVFDWVCDGCARRTYQGPTPTECGGCNGTVFHRDVVWNAIRRRTEFWRFDSELHFQYWGDYAKRPEAQGEVVDVMSALGACFFMERSRFWELGGLDEAHGSWGQFGVEIACKSWLSGGRHVVNKRTWFSHLFRTQGGDFGFPYALTGVAQEAARAYSRKLWRTNSWSGQTRPLRWLLEKFAPVNGWSEEQIDALPSLPVADRDVHGSVCTTDLHTMDSPTAVTKGCVNECQEQIDALPFLPVCGFGLDRVDSVHSEGSAEVPKTSNIGAEARSTKGLVYYTDNECPELIAEAVRKQLTRVALGPIVSVSLKPVEWPAPVMTIVPEACTKNCGRENWITENFSGNGNRWTMRHEPELFTCEHEYGALQRGYLTMFDQILAGLEALDTDVAFLVEHDVLYPAEHFEFTPPRDDVYYYNQNVWKVDAKTGRALHYLCSQTSGLCANRELLVEHYTKRVEQVFLNGYSRAMGFEPGTHRRKERVDDFKAETWFSSRPLVDIRHSKNLTPSRWKKEQFRNQKYCAGWTEAAAVPGWGVTYCRFPEFLKEAVSAS